CPPSSARRRGRWSRRRTTSARRWSAEPSIACGSPTGVDASPSPSSRAMRSPAASRSPSIALLSRRPRLANPLEAAPPRGPRAFIAVVVVLVVALFGVGAGERHRVAPRFHADDRSNALDDVGVELRRPRLAERGQRLRPREPFDLERRYRRP